MGEISVDFELENPIDRGILERGLGEQSSVRRTRVQGIVNTGAIMLVLPQNVVERLGLQIQATVHSTSRRSGVTMNVHGTSAVTSALRATLPPSTTGATWRMQALPDCTPAST